MAVEGRTDFPTVKKVGNERICGRPSVDSLHPCRPETCGPRTQKRSLTEAVDSGVNSRK